MDFVGGRDHFLLQQRVGIVFAALQFRNDDRAFRFAVVGIVDAVGHPFGLDEQHAIEAGSRRGLHVGGLVDPRIAVPAAAEFFDDAFHLVARNVGRALEIHVLDPVRYAREAGHLVFRADFVPAPNRCKRRGVHFCHKHRQAVVEDRRCHIAVHYNGRRRTAPDGLYVNFPMKSRIFGEFGWQGRCIVG